MLPFTGVSGFIVNGNGIEHKNIQKRIECGFIVKQSSDQCIFVKIQSMNDHLSNSMEDFTITNHPLIKKRHQSMTNLPISIRKDRFQDEHAYNKMYSFKGLVDKIQYPSIERILKSVDRWDFNIFSLERFTAGFPLTYLATELFVKYNLLREFQLDMSILHKFFITIEKSYHEANPYHNALHAADVTQAINCIIQDPVIFQNLSKQDILVALLSTICHDVDHPGLNNMYLNNSSHFLSQFYKKESVLENHHWSFSLAVIKELGLFSHFSTELWNKVISNCASLIRATDISKQNFYINKFNESIVSKVSSENYSNSSISDDENLSILQMAIKCADICNPCRKWDICNCWAYLVTEEFFQQGDKEKANSLPVSPIMDRDKCKLAVIQRDFIRFLVLPLFTAWSNYARSELSNSFLNTIQHNSSLWQQLAELPASESDSVVLASVQSVYDRLQLMQVMDYTQGHQLSHLQQLHTAFMTHQEQETEDVVIAAATASYAASNRSSMCLPNVEEDNSNSIGETDDFEESNEDFIVQQQRQKQRRRSSRDVILEDDYLHTTTMQTNSRISSVLPPHYTRRGSLPITLQTYSRDNNNPTSNVASFVRKKQQQQKLLTRRTSLQTGPGFSTLLTGLATSNIPHGSGLATCGTTPNQNSGSIQSINSNTSSIIGALNNDNNNTNTNTTTNNSNNVAQLSLLLLELTSTTGTTTTATNTNTNNNPPLFPTSYRRGSAPAIKATMFYPTNPPVVQNTITSRRRASLTGGCGITQASILSSHLKQHANSLQDIQIP